MEDYQQRILDEKTELDTKLCSLKSFLYTDPFKELRILDQSLLLQQEVAMSEYSSILAERICIFQ